MRIIKIFQLATLVTAQWNPFDPFPTKTTTNAQPVPTKPTTVAVLPSAAVPAHTNDNKNPVPGKNPTDNNNKPTPGNNQTKTEDDFPTDPQSPNLPSSDQSLNISSILGFIFLFALIALLIICGGVFFIKRNKRKESRECLMDLQRSSSQKIGIPSIVQIDPIQKMFQDKQVPYFKESSREELARYNDDQVPYFKDSSREELARYNDDHSGGSGASGGYSPQNPTEVGSLFVDENGNPYSQEEVDLWNLQQMEQSYQRQQRRLRDPNYY
jgi:hypothetical protein